MKFTTFPENLNPFQKKGIVKFGIDPSGTSLHLGHLLPLKIVKMLKDNGCQIHIVLGTFTSTIGDATGRDATRPLLNKDVVLENTKLILPQIKRILGEDIIIHYNNEWFDKMQLPQMMSILSNFTVQNLLNRESFQNRINSGSTISMQELIYPLLQGMDSVVLESTYEIGGLDQLLNMIKGRELQEINGIEPQICVMAPIINGTDGRKMSKSFNNCIYINDEQKDVFGKVMSISDKIMMEWYPLFFESFDVTKHPMLLKKDLAEKITDEIWGIGAGKIERANFENRFSKGLIPEDIMEVEKDSLINFISVVNKCSKTDSRRLLQSNSVSVNDKKISDINHVLMANDIVRIGKRGIAKVV